MRQPPKKFAPPPIPTRAQETRAAMPTREDQRRDYDALWQAKGSLTAPTARPGMEQRWVRMAIGAEGDPENLSKRAQHLWVPRPADTVPLHEAPAPSRVGGQIRVRGMVLCERPVEVGESRQRYMRGQTKQQMSKVRRQMEDSAYVEHGMRPFVAPETKRVVERGAGVESVMPREVTIADDS